MNRTYCNVRHQRASKNKMAGQLLDHTNASLISSIAQFVDEINEMNNAVLVPSRLMDCESEYGDLYVMYNMVNQVKNELTLGRLDEDRKQTTATTATTTASSTTSSTPPISNNNNFNSYNVSTPKPSTTQTSTTTSSHALNECDDGFSSLNSFGISDDECSDYSDSECGSKIGTIDGSECLISLFRVHIQGLESSLKQFSLVARRVKNAYQQQYGDQF